MSYKIEVIADSSGEWAGNSLRFATRDEAEAYAQDLLRRWLLVRTTRVTNCDDPVNYVWNSGYAVPIDTGTSRLTVGRGA